MKKILSLLLISILAFSFTGCGDSENKKKDTSKIETKQETKDEILKENQTKQESKEKKSEIDKESISEEKKKELKNKIENALTDKNVTSVDILTLSNGEPKAMIQLKGNILKEDVKKDEAIEVCKNIGNKVKSICKNYEIELDDKNSQFIILVDQDGESS